MAKFLRPTSTLSGEVTTTPASSDRIAGEDDLAFTSAPASSALGLQAQRQRLPVFKQREWCRRYRRPSPKKLTVFPRQSIPVDARTPPRTHRPGTDRLWKDHSAAAVLHGGWLGSRWAGDCLHSASKGRRNKRGSKSCARSRLPSRRRSRIHHSLRRRLKSDQNAHQIHDRW